MAHGSNTDSAAVAWYIIIDSTAYTLSSRGEYFVSVMDSSDVYIIYLTAHCFSMPLAVRFNDETTRDSRSVIATPVLCPLMFPALL